MSEENIENQEIENFIKKYQDGTFDPVSSLSESELIEITTQWKELSSNGILRLEVLEADLEKKKDEKIDTFMLNARKKMERHPSKKQLVEKVLNNSTKTLERQNRLQSTRIKTLLRIVRKADGDNESALDDLTQDEFITVMALRIAEKKQIKDLPKAKHVEDKVKKTKEQLEKLKKVVNTPKRPQ